jgi:hypothetical protein
MEFNTPMEDTDDLSIQLTGKVNQALSPIWDTLKCSTKDIHTKYQRHYNTAIESIVATMVDTYLQQGGKYR